MKAKCAGLKSAGKEAVKLEAKNAKVELKAAEEVIHINKSRVDKRNSRSLHGYF